MNELGARLKSKAHELGFDLVGITSPEPPPHLDVFVRWLDSGRHGEMAYLATERSRVRRSDPHVILPECQTILVVGSNYARSGDTLPGSAVNVAAYALGLDYHDLLLDRARRLVRYLQVLAGRDISHRVYTDTGPVLERELAQRAGLGWIGKNTCLINPQVGSYVLLSEILLGIALEPDPPFKQDFCGTCSRCLRACPTGCILPDRTLDARRCISYLTIELRGLIPEDLRRPIGSWLFGCDICQQVCPWNQRFARPTTDASFSPRPILANPPLASFLGSSNEELREAIRGTALTRARLDGLRRNACLVAGNRREAALVPALGRLLVENTHPAVRAHAAWALGRMGGVQAIDVLIAARRAEGDPQVLEEINLALAS